MSNGRLHQAGESRPQQFSKTVHSQFFAMAVIGEPVDRRINAELAHPILTDASVEHLKGGNLIHRDHGAFVLHQAAQNGAEDFTGHALQALTGFASESFVLVIKQPQIHLGNATGGDMTEHFREQPHLQAPIGGNAQIHRQIGGEGEFTSQGVAKGLQIAQVRQWAKDLFEADQQGTDEQAGGPTLQRLGFQR